MKDITITGRDIKREFFILLGALLFACALNAYSIITYDTEWSELISMLPMTLIVGCVIYLLLAVIRVIIFLCKSIFCKGR